MNPLPLPRSHFSKSNLGNVLAFVNTYGTTFPVFLALLPRSNPDMSTSTNDPMFTPISDEELNEIFERAEAQAEQCGLCLNVAITDWRNSCGNGGCHFCNDCLTKLVASRPRHAPPACPGCRGDLLRDRNGEFAKNPAMNDTVKSLTLQCPHFDKGCEWSGNMLKLKNHLQTECNFVVIRCMHRNIGCCKEFPRNEAQDHYNDPAAHSNLVFGLLAEFNSRMESIERKFIEHRDSMFESMRNTRSDVLSSREEARESLRASNEARSSNRTLANQMQSMERGFDALRDVVMTFRADLPKKRASPGSGQSKSAVRERNTKQKVDSLREEKNSLALENRSLRSELSAQGFGGGSGSAGGGPVNVDSDEDEF